MRSSTFLAGIVIVLVAGALSATDLLMKEWPRYTETVAVDPGTSSSSAVSSSVASSDVGMMSSVSSSVDSSMAMSSSASSTKVVKKGTSTKKAGGANIEAVLQQFNLTQTQTSEASFLFLTTPNQPTLKTTALLLNNDRAFLFSWLESADAKTILRGLKTALQEQFSGKLSDLVDETRTPANGPVVDYLSFFDPALSPEKVVFLRVRNRLYEIHVAKNGEGLVEQLVADLSR